MNERELVSVYIKQCTKCDLHVGVTPVPFYSRTANPKVVVIGHGPGKHELAQGVPWVGPSGKVARRLLEDAQLDSVGWLNVVCCDDNPKARHIDACRSNFSMQMEALKPSYALVFGGLALDALLPFRTPLTAIRGRWWTLSTGQWAMATYHPAVTLYDHARKYEKVMQHDIATFAKSVLLADLAKPHISEECLKCHKWATCFIQDIGFCEQHMPQRLRKHKAYQQLNLL